MLGTKIIVIIKEDETIKTVIRRDECWETKKSNESIRHRTSSEYELF